VIGIAQLTCYTLLGHRCQRKGKKKGGRVCAFHSDVVVVCETSMTPWRQEDCHSLSGFFRSRQSMSKKRSGIGEYLCSDRFGYVCRTALSTKRSTSTKLPCQGPRVPARANKSLLTLSGIQTAHHSTSTVRSPRRIAISWNRLDLDRPPVYATVDTDILILGVVRQSFGQEWKRSRERYY
jgi:hypothetical protein